MKRKRKEVKIKPMSIKKILVPFDFSEYSANALREAIVIARTFMAQIELIHVITPVYMTSTSRGALIPYESSFYKKIMNEATKKLTSIAKEIETKEAIKINVKTSLNIIYTAILDHADKIKADLIIMGTHGTSGVQEFFIGSNAYRIVNKSSCPVITVQKKITKKGFKSIVLPIRSELNSRQKVNLVALLAKAFMSTVYITGYTDSGSKTETMKVKSYMAQVEKFLNSEAIEFKSAFITGTNFTKSIIDHALKNKADLIAIMTNHDFSIDQIFSGVYAQQFVNHSKLPVLCVPNTLDFEYSFTNPLLGSLEFN